MEPPVPRRAVSAPLPSIPLQRFTASLVRLVAALALVMIGFASAHALTRHDTGRWTPPSASWGGTEVHMALLPGSGSSYHSKVMWWYGLGEEYNQYAGYGGLWGWTPGD